MDKRRDVSVSNSVSASSSRSSSRSRSRSPSPSRRRRRSRSRSRSRSRDRDARRDSRDDAYRSRRDDREVVHDSSRADDIRRDTRRDAGDNRQDSRRNMDRDHVDADRRDDRDSYRNRSGGDARGRENNDERGGDVRKSIAFAKEDASMPKLNSICKARIIRLEPYGAFAEISGYKKHGLIHISQLSAHRVDVVSEVLTVGETVAVKVVDLDDNKISLSMKYADQTKEIDLDPAGVEYSREKSRRSKGKGDDGGRNEAITIKDVYLNTTCPRCGGRGHMAHECRARPGESYEFVPAEEPEPEPAPAPRQMEPSRTKKMSIHQEEKKHKHHHHHHRHK